MIDNLTYRIFEYKLNLYVFVMLKSSIFPMSELLFHEFEDVLYDNTDHDTFAKKKL